MRRKKERTRERKKRRIKRRESIERKYRIKKGGIREKGK